MQRRALKAEVCAFRQARLVGTKPSNGEGLNQFERRVVKALRDVLKSRLHMNFLKSRWLKDEIRNRFHKSKVTLTK